MDTMPTQPAPGTIEAPAPLTGPEIAHEVARAITGLCAVIAAAFDRHPIFVYIVNDLWNRLNRAKQRFTRAMDHLAAGRKPRPRRPGTAAGAVGGMPPAKLPTAHGWLLNAIPYKAAAYQYQLELLFARPGVEDLIKSSPEAQRILRPICHMLGMKPAFLARPRIPRAKKPRPRRGKTMITRWRCIARCWKRSRAFLNAARRCARCRRGSPPARTRDFSRR